LIVPASFISVRHSSGVASQCTKPPLPKSKCLAPRPPSSYKITKSTAWSAARAPGASPSPSL
jgi:hypothetical protein